ncbi:MAG: FAD-dependent oxidoreductase [Gemmatimonadota bacterium]
MGIVGAGIAGLAAARALAERGFEPRVFEKSRGLGGRAATRRIGDLGFDHGAQYFTVRSPGFARVLEPLLPAGEVARWEPRLTRLGDPGAGEPVPQRERYVGVPGMSTLGRALATGVPVTRGTRVAALRSVRGGGWEPVAEDGAPLGRFGAMLVTCPPPQSAELLRPLSPGLAAACDAATMLPCWAVMAAFDAPPDVHFDAAFVAGGPLAWLARDSSKPGRTQAPDCWTLHASASWSAVHLEAEGGVVARSLLESFFDVAGTRPRDPVRLQAHRWRYARAEPGVAGRDSADAGARRDLVDAGARLALAGDWTRGNRLEDAWLSGVEAAEAIAQLFLEADEVVGS